MSRREPGHLWAIGYADIERADQVKEEVIRLGWDEHYLMMLSDVAVSRDAKLRGRTEIGALLGTVGTVVVLIAIVNSQNGGTMAGSGPSRQIFADMTGDNGRCHR